MSKRLSSRKGGDVKSCPKKWDDLKLLSLKKWMILKRFLKKEEVLKKVVLKKRTLNWGQDY